MKKAEQLLILKKLKSRLGKNRNRIRSLNDLTCIDVDFESENASGDNRELFESSRTLDRQFDLESQIGEIRKRIKKRTADLGESFRANRSDRKIIDQLKDDLKELQMKERLKYIITRVNEDARQKLFDSEKFSSLFSERSECEAFVLSMDIRRSTELMLTAVSPELYAEFITSLTEKLSDCITDNFGIFEKFTGDGVIAFFPDFYSGEDALLFAVKTSVNSHRIFLEHLAGYTEYFSMNLDQTGLGIGVDTGIISLTTINGDLSIVGKPVVYACRYSAAPAGKTYFTGKAYGMAMEILGSGLRFSSVNINVKHEGDATAYELVSGGENLNVQKPDWDFLTEKFSR